MYQEYAREVQHLISLSILICCIEETHLSVGKKVTAQTDIKIRTYYTVQKVIIKLKKNISLMLVHIKS